MATGDSNDFLSRLKAALPTGWFPDVTPVLDAVLTGPAYAWAWIYSLIGYANQQTRLSTATGNFLDILAIDFLGSAVSRNPGESDTAFRARIKREILRPKATRAALIQELTDITGTAPVIFEPANSTDTGGYNLGGVGYGVAAGYGCLQMPFQFLVTAYRPPIISPPSLNGWGGGLGGYGVGSTEYIDRALVDGISDAEIYAAVASVIPAATVAWTQLTNIPPTAALLDESFVLDLSVML